MTIYQSQLTPKGNSSYSHTSQQEADARAAALDAAVEGTFSTLNLNLIVPGV